MPAIEVGCVAGIIPPPSLAPLCTVRSSMPVIVSVIGTELHPIVPCHSIEYCPLARPQAQCVVGILSTQTGCLVHPAEGLAVGLLHVDPQLNLAPSGEAVDVPQPVPELAIEVPKPVLVVLPVAVEVGCSPRNPPLDDQPASPICVHVALCQLSGVAKCIKVAVVAKLILACWSHSVELLHLHVCMYIQYTTHDIVHIYGHKWTYMHTCTVHVQV